MKVAMLFASVVIGLASVGAAQAADEPTNGASVQAVSAGHDPYYPAVASRSAKTRTEVVKELQQAETNGSLAGPSHNAYYPAHVTQ